MRWGAGYNLVILGLVAAVTACTGNVAEPGPGATPTGNSSGSGGGGGGVVGPDAGTSVAAGGDGGMIVDDNSPVEFERDIQPILLDYCVRCHGGVRQLGTPPMSLQAKETSAFALGAGTAESSLLYLRVTATDPRVRMPLGGAALPADKVSKLRRWLNMGAPWPVHWAFRARQVVDPATMTVSDASWVRTPVDRFILNRLDQARIKPSPEADPVTLIRRLSLDLTGLPPTLADVDAFTADTSATAYEKVVDRLLASPAFGERWGRHWLDQARYADSDGYEKDLPRLNAWRWRDWVVDAFNSDMPFDQFTIQQIAGDLMPAKTPLTVLGTGLHNQTLFNREDGVVAEEDRTHRTIDRAATVSNVWLGLTFQCIDCHSHAYDRVSQKEFYSFYAFFNNADEGTATVPTTSRAGDTTTTTADVMAERTSARRQTFLLTRGDYLQPDTVTGPLTPGTPAILHPLKPRGATPDRLDLANWLVDPANPVTARVIVNTIWYHLFGAGIVASIMDFGNRAALPSHPELLDWLANDFIQGGWRRKRVIKEIVLSAAYRQSSVLGGDSLAKDQQNTLFGRQNRLRLEAEPIIDAHLAASGLLSPKVGGPAVFPPLQPEVRPLIPGAYATFQWVQSTGGDLFRRGLYTFHKRAIAYPNLSVFDWPAADASVNGRTASDTALQALTTLHAAQFVTAAQAFARRIQTDKAGAPLRDQIVYAWRLAVARTPTEGEITELTGLFNDSLQLYAANTAAISMALGAYAPAGVAATTAAAWVATARAILNTDELVTRE